MDSSNEVFLGQRIQLRDLILKAKQPYGVKSLKGTLILLQHMEIKY